MKADCVDWRGGADQGPLPADLVAFVHQVVGTAVGTVCRHEPGDVGSGFGKRLANVGWLLGNWSMYDLGEASKTDTPPNGEFVSIELLWRGGGYGVIEEMDEDELTSALKIVLKLLLK